MTPDERDAGAESTTTTIPIGDSPVGLRVSQTTLITNGDETRGVKLRVGAGDVRGSVVMSQATAATLCEALKTVLDAE